MLYKVFVDFVGDKSLRNILFWLLYKGQNNQNLFYIRQQGKGARLLWSGLPVAIDKPLVCGYFFQSHRAAWA